jgi:hypothetical protein
VSVVSGLLLTDSTVPVNFSKAGGNCAIAMLKHLGERLHMVAEVHGELTRLAAESVSLQRFLEEFPEDRVRTLSRELTATVGAVQKTINAAGTHPREDIGEIATVFYAEQRRDEGEVFDLITDDHTGRTLASDRGLKVITTPSLVVEMVCAGALDYSDGNRVWQRCFTNRAKWKVFRERIERDCPQRLAAETP